MLKCVGNDCHRKAIINKVKYREANAIEANAPFFDDEMGKLLRVFKRVQPAAILVFYKKAGSSTVYMSLHQMAIEAAVHGYAAFNVYRCARLPMAQVGFAKGFGNSRYRVLPIGHCFYGKANAIVAYALVRFKGFAQCTCYSKCSVAARLTHGYNGSCGFYNACKHDFCKLFQQNCRKRLADNEIILFLRP